MVPPVAGSSGSDSWASSPATRKSMQGNRSRDTKPELAVRSAVHRRGIRFRVSARPLREFPRTADLVLRKTRIAVFVDGCYWHGCPQHHTQPSTNSEYWADKIARNVERDSETTRRLEDAGWTVLRFWEHEDPEAVADHVEATVNAALSKQCERPAGVEGQATGLTVDRTAGNLMSERPAGVEGQATGLTVDRTAGDLMSERPAGEEG